MAYIKINKQNFFYNLNQIALQTGSLDKVSIVLKDNAYGHGLVLMASLASEFGVRHAVVRKTDEADKISKFFDTVLILGDTIVKHPQYSFAINSMNDIDTAQKGAKVELKVDTGMHRNGIALYELDKALGLIKSNGLELVGVMTHYRSADVLSSEFFWQQKNFEFVKKRVKTFGYNSVRFHSHNSASILRRDTFRHLAKLGTDGFYPRVFPMGSLVLFGTKVSDSKEFYKKSFDEDMVRVGIGAYGYNELDSSFDNILLKPVLSLFAKKVSTREVKKGERVGYGGDYIASKTMKISTYNLGYGDGWFRGMYVSSSFVTAEKLSILGRVSMDFITLETEKEEVCIFDDAQEVAKQLKTISYEILTALHCDIKRVVV